MAEDARTTTTAEGGEGKAARPTPAEPERDWRAEYEKAVAQSRKWEQRSKDNAAAAKELEALKDASKTDAERLADATKRAEKAEEKLAEYERRAERAALVAEVAAAKGVDAEWLGRMVGDGREAIEANADYIASRLSGAHIYPSVSDNGGGKGAPITREQIEAIKDPKERVLMRARHIGLYR